MTEAGRSGVDRPGYDEALARTGLLDLLAPFDPHVAGTPPLGLALPSSDIDIVCHAPDAGRFAALMWDALSDRPGFSMRQWTGRGRAVVVGFLAEGWAFEIFAAAQPVALQAGWRHFTVERRLLTLGGEAFRAAVMRLRQEGLKTEPAFAAALGVVGDPYAALLEMGEETDGSLAGRLRAAGFQVGGGSVVKLGDGSPPSRG
jgi:hypothetical protein